MNDSIGGVSFELEKTNIDCTVSFASLTPTFCQNLVRFWSLWYGKFFAYLLRRRGNAPSQRASKSRFLGQPLSPDAL